VSSKWILYVGGFEMPDGNAAAQRVTANGKAFRFLGYEIFFVGLSRKENPNGTIRNFEGFEYVNFPYPKNLFNWIDYLFTIKQFKPYLKKLPDLIIAYNYPAIALEKLRVWGLKNNIPIVADCTEWYEAKGNIIFRLVKGLDTKLRMTRVHPKLNGMIAISDYLFHYYNGKMRNVVNIPPLVDLEMTKWSIDNTDFRSNKNEQVRIIYAGSPGSGGKDRLDIIFKILSQIKEEGILNFYFFVIGMSKEQYLMAFKTLLPDNLAENIVFQGRLKHTDTLNEIKKADFNLFLRDDNLTNMAGFPTKFVESVSCGTPVLTNSSSNIKNYIIDGRNGFLIDDKTDQSLKIGIKNALILPKSEIQIMKQWCLSSTTFHYKNYVNSFEELVENIG
jgi:glycosyltransferase involved in cell wall biosynthesis